ncbi:DMT family transporter [Paenibacillus sophorae]|uniref:EamA family transporter n=1 Tax=Paenibacillus sophorae TaxID=1333845 RepID=A0ABX8H8K0_9BACL|nr:EamA family transporter [Paenibacillus sophorae]QWU14535.1 EamA family transporter [Paenibacillus sophorae]
MNSSSSSSGDHVQTKMSSRRVYILLALLVVFIWGFNFIVADKAVSQIPPFLLVAMRYFVVALIFLPFTKRNGLPWKYLILVGFFGGVVQFSGLFWGLSLGVSSGVAATLIQSQAIFTILLATLFINEKFSWFQWAGLLAGAAGLVLIAASGDASAPIVGVLWVLLGGLGWACSNIVLKKAGKISPWTLTVWQSTTVIPIMLVLSLIFESGDYAQLSNITLQGVGSVIYIALLATGLGNFIWYYLVQQFGPSNTAPFSLLVPVVAIVSGWLVLGESLTSIQAAGIVIILVGLTLIQLSSRFKRIKLINVSKSERLQAKEEHFN